MFSHDKYIITVRRKGNTLNAQIVALYELSDPATALYSPQENRLLQSSTSDVLGCLREISDHPAKTRR